MNQQPTVQIDERAIAVVHESYKWGFNFVLFALLIDVTLRGLIRHEAAWDLLALVFASSGISRIYQLRRNVDVLGSTRRKRALVLGFIFGAVIAAITALILVRK